MAITSTDTGPYVMDIKGVSPGTVVPDALILTTAVKAGFVEGDAPAVRVPFVDYADDAGFVAEGATITEASPDESSVVIHTGKIAALARVSREALTGGDMGLFTASIQRAVVIKANTAYLGQVAPTSPAVTPPAGLLNQSPTDGGTIASSLDALADAVMGIEAANGQASHIIASPTAFASLSKLKTATGSNSSLVGAGVEAAERLLLGVPVVVSNAMTADTILVLDRTAVLAAIGDVQIATSTDAYFNSDSVGMRVTWRFGVKIADTSRVIKLTVTDPTV